MMASIYGNAFVIILAADSDNSCDSILQKRELKTNPIRESAGRIYDRKPILSAHRDTFIVMDLVELAASFCSASFGLAPHTNLHSS